MLRQATLPQCVDRSSSGRGEERGGGVLRMRSLEPLLPFPERILERLAHWAGTRPDQTFVAAREAGGEWRRISYAEMFRNVRAIAQSLLSYGLSKDRPLLIVSGNDLEHLQLAFGAMYAGIPYCPVSPAYSLLSQDLAKLRHIVDLLRPGLVFAADAKPFQRAIDTVFPGDVPGIFTRGSLEGRDCVSFASLLEQPGGEEADNAFAATGPDTIAKFLFTSGSTKLPKAVPTTQRMLCANQQMLLQTFPVFGEEPRCSWTGCRGTTPSAGATTSVSCSTTAAPITLMMASQLPKGLLRLSAI